MIYLYYVLKLYDTKKNITVEGIYSTKGSAEEKAIYYMNNHRDKIRFYDIDTVALDSKLADEDMIESLYS